MTVTIFTKRSVVSVTMFDRLSGGLQHCKRCGYELDGGEEACPRCQFNPRLKGLRVAMGFVLGMIVLMLFAMVALRTLPQFAPILVVLAGVSFALAVITFLFSLTVTPHRFGSLFHRG